MAQLTLNLLGPFEATLDGGQRLQFSTVKAQALLAYLLVEEAQRPGNSHQRVHIAHERDASGLAFLYAGVTFGSDMKRRSAG